MRRNRALALAARDLLCGSLGIAAPAPDDMIGSMAALPLADSTEPPSIYGDPTQDLLLDRFGIEVPFMPWPARPARLLRVSAFLYNTLDEYRYLATSLGKLAK
jgi:isopenicillin-N epimerase